MRRKLPPIVLALAALLALPLAAGETKEKPAGTPAAPAPSAAPAMKVHIDPATGQFSAPAPGTVGALAAAPADTLPMPRVVKAPTRAGGKMVRLDDRFMMALTAKATPDGKVTVSCNDVQASSSPAAAEKSREK